MRDFFRPLAAIYKKNKVLSPAMRQFLAFSRKELEGRGWSGRAPDRFTSGRTVPTPRTGGTVAFQVRALAGARHEPESAARKPARSPRTHR